MGWEDFLGFIFLFFPSYFGPNKTMGLRIGSGLSNLACCFISGIFHLFSHFCHNYSKPKKQNKNQIKT